MASRIPRPRRTTVLSLAALSALAAGVVAACSLGLDESLIAAAPDAGDRPDTSVDTGLSDAGVDAAPSADAGPCTKDEDCVSTNACLKGRCDLARNACAFDVCRPSACNAGVCDTAAKTCGAPKPYGLRPSQFKVGASALNYRCIAAVHPYLFVGTVNGVVAFNMSNPTLTPPPAVPVTGLGFAPSFFVTTGSRVWFVGTPLGGGPPSRIPVAWVDVPSDPFVTSLKAEDALAGWNRSSGEGIGVLARAPDGALVYSGAGGLPAAVFPQAPTDRFDLTSVPTPTPPGTGLVSMSGTRLLMQSVDANGNAAFGFVPNAGTPAVSDAGLSVAAAAKDTGIVAGPQYFSQGSDGTVLWSFAALTATPPTPGVAVRAVRASFLVGGAAANADGPAVDVEVYPPNIPNGTNVTGPNALVSPDVAMFVTAAKENINQTAVAFVKRQPLALVAEADGKPRRAVLPIALPTLVGAAGSNGIGYLLANEPAAGPEPANASVYVFDPACAP